MRFTRPRRPCSRPPPRRPAAPGDAFRRRLREGRVRRQAGSKGADLLRRTGRGQQSTRGAAVEGGTYDTRLAGGKGEGRVVHGPGVRVRSKEDDLPFGKPIFPEFTAGSNSRPPSVHDVAVLTRKVIHPGRRPPPAPSWGGRRFGPVYREEQRAEEPTHADHRDDGRGDGRTPRITIAVPKTSARPVPGGGGRGCPGPRPPAAPVGELAGPRRKTRRSELHLRRGGPVRRRTLTRCSSTPTSWCTPG